LKHRARKASDPVVAVNVARVLALGVRAPGGQAWSSLLTFKGTTERQALPGRRDWLRRLLRECRASHKKRRTHEPRAHRSNLEALALALELPREWFYSPGEPLDVLGVAPWLAARMVELYAQAAQHHHLDRATFARGLEFVRTGAWVPPKQPDASPRPT